MGYSSRGKKKKIEKDDRFFSMLCFQISVCLVTLAVFFCAVQMGGENKAAAQESAACFVGAGRNFGGMGRAFKSQSSIGIWLGNR